MRVVHKDDLFGSTIKQENRKTPEVAIWGGRLSLRWRTWIRPSTRETEGNYTNFAVDFLLPSRVSDLNYKYYSQLVTFCMWEEGIGRWWRKELIIIKWISPKLITPFTKPSSCFGHCLGCGRSFLLLVGQRGHCPFFLQRNIIFTSHLN